MATTVDDRVNAFQKLLSKADRQLKFKLVELLKLWSNNNDDDENADESLYSKCFESLYESLLFDDDDDDDLKNVALQLRRETINQNTLSHDSKIVKRALDELSLPFNVLFAMLDHNPKRDYVLDKLLDNRNVLLNDELCRLLLCATTRKRGSGGGGVHSLVRLSGVKSMRQTMIQWLAKQYVASADHSDEEMAFDALAELCVNACHRTAARLALAMSTNNGAAIGGGMQAGLAAAIVLLRRAESLGLRCSAKCTAALSLLSSK
jgi:hypothetical protein